MSRQARRPVLSPLGSDDLERYIHEDGTATVQAEGWPGVMVMDIRPFVVARLWLTYTQTPSTVPVPCFHLQNVRRP